MKSNLLNKEIQKVYKTQPNKSSNDNVISFMTTQNPIFNPKKGSHIQVKFGNGNTRRFTKFKDYDRLGSISGGHGWRMGNEKGNTKFSFQNTNKKIKNINHISQAPLNKTKPNWYLGNIHFTDSIGRHYGRPKNTKYRVYHKIKNTDKWNMITTSFASGLKKLAAEKIRQNRINERTRVIKSLRENKQGVNSAILQDLEILEKFQLDIEKLNKSIENWELHAQGVKNKPRQSKKK